LNTTDVLNSAGGEQLGIYGNGIIRMFTDLESYIYPFFSKLQPLLYALANIHFIIIPVLFVLLILYITLYKKHRLLNKLEKKKNLYTWGGLLVLYLILSFCKFSIGFGLSFDLSRLVLPAVAKFYGPIIACLFAIAQYMLTSIFKSDNFNLMLLLVGAISGILYGILFYRKRTRYTTCITSKIIVSVICNVFLTVFVTYSLSSLNIAQQMTQSSIVTILSSPIQALGIFLVFRIVRIIKNHL